MVPIIRVCRYFDDPSHYFPVIKRVLMLISDENHGEEDYHSEG